MVFINFVLFNFVLGSEIICVLQSLVGRLVTKNEFFSDNNFAVTIN